MKVSAFPICKEIREAIIQLSVIIPYQEKKLLTNELYIYAVIALDSEWRREHFFFLSKPMFRERETHVPFMHKYYTLSWGFLTGDAKVRKMINDFQAK